MNIVRYNEVDDSSYISNLDVAGRQINMKPFKTLCIVLLAAMLVLTTAACGSKGKTNDNLQTGGRASQKQDKKTIVCSADYPEYTSVDDLSAHADYVVYGTVLSERYESMSLRIPESGAESAEAGQDNEQTVVTVYEVRVKESYSGAVSSGDVLKVMLLGGETEDTVYQYEDSPEIEVGSEYVFFLSGSQIVENGAWLLNNTQALYAANGETVSKTAEQGFALSFDRLEAIKAQ